jgi:hypothetical protein
MRPNGNRPGGNGAEISESGFKDGSEFNSPAQEKQVPADGTKRRPSPLRRFLLSTTSHQAIDCALPPPEWPKHPSVGAASTERAGAKKRGQI